MDSDELILHLEKAQKTQRGREIIIHDRTTGKNFLVYSVDAEFEANQFYIEFFSEPELESTDK